MWLDPEDIILSEVSQTKKQIHQDLTYVWSRKTIEGVQFLGFWASTARDTGSVPGHGTKIAHTVQCSQNQRF